MSEHWEFYATTFNSTFKSHKQTQPTPRLQMKYMGRVPLCSTQGESGEWDKNQHSQWSSRSRNTRHSI
jgi:hypothetical protein